MSNDTITIALDGEIYLDDLATALRCFHELASGLSNEVAPDAGTEWRVASLESGSAIATARVVGGTECDRASAVNAFETAARAIEEGRPVPFSQCVRKAARGLTTILNGRVTSIRFETAEFDAEVLAPVEGPKPSERFRVQRGAVRGRIQSLSNRGGLRFTLYDELDDHAVSCYSSPGYEDLMRKAWGKFALVEGEVRRNVQTGRASTVRRVTHVEVLEEGSPLDYRDAIGCAPAAEGSLSAEEAVRRGRDA